MISLDIKGGRATINRLNVLGHKVNNLSPELVYDIASDAADAIKDQAEIQGHQFTGNLIESIRPERLTEDNVIVKMHFYGLFVEKGTSGSNKPAPIRLRKWVETRLGVDKSKSQAVANAIREKGTEAHWFIRNALKYYDASTKIEEFKTQLEST